MNSVYDDKNFFDQYAKMSRSQQGLSGASEWHQFKAMFHDLSGKNVLDLGCGYGWHCKYAVECGAKQVLGIDMSEKMIQEAKKKNADPKINYQVCSVESYDYPAESYDCVISNLVLHYIADIDSVFRKICRTLKADGVFLLNIEHPVFTAGVNQDWIYDANGRPQYWPIDDYFYPGMRMTRFLGMDVMKQHHTLTQILMGLVHAGFRLETVEEAMPGADRMDLPGESDEMRRPMMLLIQSLKK
ncbi:MAG: class I SAM-dependent methyltransferase [Bacillota bacterium]|nr:class I SAM-dependent methyltransferase [Bacillota bacterium]